MGRLRVLSGKQICAIPARHGYTEVRRRGSHVVMQKSTADTTITVPVPDHDDLTIPFAQVPVSREYGAGPV